jgi:hypothetical protein
MHDTKDEIREIKEQLIKAGKTAARELIKVAEEAIVNTSELGKDPLAADKLKTAAAAKKASIFDAFEILDKVESEEKKLLSPEDDSEQASKAPQIEDKDVDFKSAEQRV